MSPEMLACMATVYGHAYAGARTRESASAAQMEAQQATQDFLNFANAVQARARSR